MENYKKSTSKRKEDGYVPFDMELFHEKCPTCKDHTVSVVADIHSIALSCRGGVPVAKPVLMEFVNELFDHICAMDKDQIICKCLRLCNAILCIEYFINCFYLH